MTAQYARFGDRSIFSIGFLAFLSLAFLAFLERSLRRPALARLINLVLVIAFAGEGFFMGYLAFRLHTICLICVSIFGFFVTLGVIRLVAGERDLLAGFGALAAVFVLQYLMLPVGIPVDLPLGERLILFYSKDCRHCAELMAELDRKKITVAHLPASDYARFLKDMGIESVPTLMVNDPLEKVFLTGKDAIDRYLDSCTTTGPRAGDKQKKGKKTVSGQSKPPPGKTNTETPLDLFGQSGILSLPMPTVDDSGTCRQDAACK